MASIKHYLVINSTLQKVFEALTTHKGIAGWWTSDNVMPIRVGEIAEFRFGNRYHNKMEIAELKENEFVKWICIEGDKEWIGTTFTFQLEPTNDKVVLRFEHCNWKEETDFFANCNYHWGHYMRSLKDFCETGNGMPFENYK